MREGLLNLERVCELQVRVFSSSLFSLSFLLPYFSVLITFSPNQKIKKIKIKTNSKRHKKKEREYGFRQVSEPQPQPQQGSEEQEAEAETKEAEEWSQFRGVV